MNKINLLQKAKPILFNTEMVKAILEGRKTQTRRISKLENIDCPYCEDYLVPYGWANDMEIGYQCINEDCMHTTSINQKPKYKASDILYVRETWNYDDQDNKPYYRVDFDINSANALGMIWKPSIHMPKKYARIFLKVTNVRVERLQDITRKDVLSEGIREHAVNQFHPHTCLFETLWNSTTKKGYKWEDNPYVFVYEFERVEDD